MAYSYPTDLCINPAIHRHFERSLKFITKLQTQSGQQLDETGTILYCRLICSLFNRHIKYFCVQE